jgi:hypothetical protein
VQDSRLTLLWAAALLSALFLGVQVAALQRPVLTGSDQSMAKYDSFRAHVREDGHHDLIIFGNSTAHRGVDVPQLKPRLQDKRGAPVVAYNFGAGGTSAETLPFMIELAYGIDRPPTAVIIVTPIAIRRRDEGRLASSITSPYGAALYDSVAWRGSLRRWLLDRVELFGVRYALRSRLVGEAPIDWNDRGYDDGYGFHAALGQEQPDPSRRRPNRPFQRPMEDDQVQLMVSAVQRLQSYGTEVWLAEVPMNPNRYTNLAAVRTHVEEGMLRIAARTGAHALLLPDDLDFPPGMFANADHMNPEGATQYTEWLARHLELPAE